MFAIDLIRFTNGDAFSCCLIIFLVIFTWNTFWYIWLKICIFRTWLTFISKLVPVRSCQRTGFTCACSSVNNRLIRRASLTQFIDRIPSWFIFGTHTDTGSSLITWSYWSETDTFVSLLIKFIPSLTGTNSFSKWKNWSLWTSEACIVYFIRKWSL